MKRKQIVLAALMAALLLFPSSSMAVTVSPTLPEPEPVPAAPRALRVDGVLHYETDLESPHYVVGGWALKVADTTPLQSLVGKWVEVTGTEYQGISILMRPQLEVTQMRTRLEGHLSRLEESGAVRYELGGWVLQGDLRQLEELAGQDVSVTGWVVFDAPAGQPTLTVEKTMAASAGDRAPAEPEVLEVSGILRYETDLETPHYAVEGWALRMERPTVLARLVGRPVTVRGTRFEGISILMRRQLQVQEIEATLEGVLERVDGADGPVYMLDGWVLMDTSRRLAELVGRRVTVTGAIVSQPVIAPARVQVLDGEDGTEAESWHVPRVVVIGGVRPHLHVPPVQLEGELMLPLRALVEAAGGEVTWNPYLRAVVIQLNGHQLIIAIGQTAVSGFRTLPAAPVIREDRTLVPLKLFEFLGYRWQWTEGTLILEPKATPAGE